jgi:hypothetical protein
VVLRASAQQLVVPYKAIVYVSGMTETWFEDRINGHYNWMMDAGSTFNLINQYGSAGGDSHAYGRDPSSGRGTVTLTGSVTAQQTSAFVA